MSDAGQLPYLIKLLGDDSDTVRAAVHKELLTFGDHLLSLIQDQEILLDKHQKSLIDNLLKDHDRKWLRDSWSEWTILDEEQRLEQALGRLAEFQSGRDYPAKLTPLLDKLAEEYDALNTIKDPFRLADFLFKEKGLKGARADYYKPDNSNLVYVIEQKRGIPISLACIYILVGKRLGLDIRGCNFPGHFLARATTKDEVLLVDCYDAGRLLSDEIIVNSEDTEGYTVLNSKDLLVDSYHIVARVLRNLVEAYDQAGFEADSKLMFELLKVTAPQD
ncbi:MAG: transglutaminase-like domain-containing protein [Planctomycetota bacterium]|nr:transglutaminase-like domain-containing protein [Planctomycetota bacterium]